MMYIDEGELAKLKFDIGQFIEQTLQAHGVGQHLQSTPDVSPGPANGALGR